MGLNLGTLNSAIQGYQQGTQWSQQQQQEQQRQQALMALGRMLGQKQPVPQGPPAGTDMSPDQAAGAAQGAQSVAQTVGWPQQAGPGGPVAPNGSPMSPVADPAAALKDPQMLARLAAMAPGGQQPQGPQLAQPGTPSMAQPGAPMKQPPVPGMSSTAQPDAAGMDDPIKAAQQSIMSIAQGIKAANPNIDPRTLALAVDQQIEQIKGVSPLTKAAMTAQIQTVKLQQDWQYKQSRLAQIDQDVAVKVQNAKTAEERVRAYADGNQLRAQVMREGFEERRYEADERSRTAVTTTGMRDATQVTTTGMRDDTSRANNTDTNARQDRGTTERQGASDAAVYRSVYAAYLKAKPKDVVGATAAARAAVSGVQQGTPRAGIPSGDPLAGGGAPAPRSGGGGPKPSAQDVAYLKQHKGDPAVVSAFKKHFGAAAAQAAMR